jgi:hypothetical protein
MVRRVRWIGCALVLLCLGCAHEGQSKSVEQRRQELDGLNLDKQSWVREQTTSKGTTLEWSDREPAVWRNLMTRP